MRLVIKSFYSAAFLIYNITMIVRYTLAYSEMYWTLAYSLYYKLRSFSENNSVIYVLRSVTELKLSQNT